MAEEGCPEDRRPAAEWPPSINHTGPISCCATDRQCRPTDPIFAPLQPLSTVPAAAPGHLLGDSAVRPAGGCVLSVRNIAVTEGTASVAAVTAASTPAPIR